MRVRSRNVGGYIGEEVMIEVNETRNGTWGWNQWNEALINWFFDAEAGDEPVMFLVDGPTAAEIYGSSRQEEAVASLCSSVKVRLTPNRPGGIYSQIMSDAHRWRRAEEPTDPPFLPLLAVSVLAAVQMGQGRVSAANYKAPYCELLGIPTSWMYPAYGDVPTLWQYLAWWLDQHHRGARGWSTFVAHDQYTNIGYARSQTLFISADGHKLGKFFRWMGLDPGAKVDPAYLLAHFRVWAPGKGLSDGAEHMLESPEFEPTLERLLTTHLRRWDGIKLPGSSRREARLLLRVRSVPKLEADLIAPRPEGFPEKLSWRSGGRTGTLMAQAEGWYGSVDLGPFGKLLRDGVGLTHGDFQLFLPGGDIHVLRLDKAAGGWISTEGAVAGDRHWLIVSEETWAEIGKKVMKLGGKGARLLPAPPPLEGWWLVKDFVPSGDADLDAGVGLQAAAPSLQNRLDIDGGLPLEARGAYLRGGAPDLWRPDIGEVATMKVEVRQGERSWAVEDQTVTRLAELDPQLKPGAAELLLDGRRFRELHMVESSRLTPPLADDPIRHDLGSRGPGPDRQLCGAVITGGSSEPTAEPVLLRRSARAWTLVGRRPGEIERVPKADPPGQWMEELELSSARFDHYPSFEVLWVVETFDWAPERRARRCGAGDLGPPLEDAETVAAWAHHLSPEASVSSKDQGPWSELQAVAREVLRDGP